MCVHIVRGCAMQGYCLRPISNMSKTLLLINAHQIAYHWLVVEGKALHGPQGISGT